MLAPPDWRGWTGSAVTMKTPANQRDLNTGSRHVSATGAMLPAGCADVFREARPAASAGSPEKSRKGF